MSRMTTYDAFVHAVNAINESIDVNEEYPPFERMLTTAEASEDVHDLGVVVVPSDPRDREEHFTIRLAERTFLLVAYRRLTRSAAWRVAERYVRSIAAQPRKYVKNPEKLRFDWLRRRIGLPLEDSVVEVSLR